MRKLISLILLAATLLMGVGCDGSRTRLNVGGDLAVYEGSTQWMFQRIPAGRDKATSFVGGYYDPQDGSITINEQLRGWGFAIVFTHELGHAFDHQRPADIWELLARYSAPGFDFNFHPDDEVEYQRAALLEIPNPADIPRALEAARAAQAAAEAKP